jgi:hypothetical protein
MIPIPLLDVDTIPSDSAIGIQIDCPDYRVPLTANLIQIIFGLTRGNLGIRPSTPEIFECFGGHFLCLIARHEGDGALVFYVTEAN